MLCYFFSVLQAGRMWIAPLFLVSWTDHGSSLERNNSFQFFTLCPCTQGTYLWWLTVGILHTAKLSALPAITLCSICRRGWSSRCEVSSCRSCWEVEGPWYLSGNSLEWPGSYPLLEHPLSQWLPEGDAHIVAEAKLQCKDHSHTCHLINEVQYCTCTLI